MRLKYKAPEALRLHKRKSLGLESVNCSKGTHWLLVSDLYVGVQYNCHCLSVNNYTKTQYKSFVNFDSLLYRLIESADTPSFEIFGSPSQTQSAQFKIV